MQIFFFGFGMYILLLFICLTIRLTLFFIYKYGYSFGSCKKWLFSEIFSLFLGRRVQNKNNQLFRQIFS